MSIFTKTLAELTVFDYFALIVFALLIFFTWYILWKKGGFSELNKIRRDTLLNKGTGDYSLKRIGAAVCLINASVISYCAVLKINLHPVFEFGIDRSEPLLIIALVGLNFAVALGATWQAILGHMNARKTADVNGAPLTPPYTEAISDEIVPTPTTEAIINQFAPPVIAQQPRVKGRFTKKEKV